MLERTLVFVDTSYLLASFYNSWETVNLSCFLPHQHALTTVATSMSDHIFPADSQVVEGIGR